MLAPTPYFADRGCHVRIYEEARTLIALGHQVCIATYHLGRDMPGIPTCRIPTIPWYRKLAAGPSWHKPYLDLLLLAKAVKTAREFRPHIIHAHLHEGAFIGLLLKKLFRCPLLFDCQGSLTSEMVDHSFIEKEGILYRLFGSVERLVNRGSDFIVTSSGEGEKDLTENWGVDPRRVQAIIDGVNTDAFRPLPSRRLDARRKLQLPLDRPVAAFLGVLNRYQGVDLLLESISLSRSAGSPLHYLIMGFPVEEYREKAERAGLSDCITFTGRVDYMDVPFFLSAADLALSPKISRTEANGKLFNYMACALPTVAFDTPVNREILGDTGVYAKYGDAGDFARQVRELAGDGDRMARLGTCVREKSEREHSWVARGILLLEIYRRMLNNERA